MVKLVIQPPARDVERASALLGEATGQILYEARARLLKGAPYLIEVEAADWPSRFADAGLSVTPVSDELLATVPEPKFVRSFRLEDHGLVSEGPSPESLPWQQIDAVVRARLRSSTTTNAMEVKVKLRGGSRGIPTPRVEVNNSTSVDSQMSTLMAVAGRAPPLLLVFSQDQTSFAGLGARTRRSTLENLQELASIIDERAPAGLRDNRLEPLAGRLIATATSFSSSSGTSALSSSSRRRDDNHDAVFDAIRLMIAAHRAKNA